MKRLMLFFAIIMASLNVQAQSARTLLTFNDCFVETNDSFYVDVNDLSVIIDPLNGELLLYSEYNGYLELDGLTIENDCSTFMIERQKCTEFLMGENTTLNNLENCTFYQMWKSSNIYVEGIFNLDGEVYICVEGEDVHVEYFLDTYHVVSAEPMKFVVTNKQTLTANQNMVEKQEHSLYNIYGVRLSKILLNGIYIKDGKKIIK